VTALCHDLWAVTCAVICNPQVTYRYYTGRLDVFNDSFSEVYPETTPLEPLRQSVLLYCTICCSTVLCCVVVRCRVPCSAVQYSTVL